MPPSISHRQPGRSRGPLVLLWLLLSFLAAAQSNPPVSPAQFDPSDVYFQGYLASRSAEQLEAAGDFQGALEKLERANQLFEAIRTYHPDWKSEMVSRRSENTAETINRVRPQAEQKINQQRNTLAELEGGLRTGAAIPDPAMPQPPGILEVNPLATRRLRDAEMEVQRLKNLLDGGSEGGGAHSGARQQIDELQKRLLAAETTVQDLRTQLTKAPVESEMTALNRRIEALEQEREAMAMALSQSRSAHTEAQNQIAALQKELGAMRQKEADLRRDLETERKVANSVVAGQRRQLDALEKEVRQKNEELSRANHQIASLMRELQESRDAFSQLRDERDSLLRERDQMAALLKLNEASRIQELIEQNMALNKNLREANEKVDRLHRENNADKDAYTDALRDLAIAKSQINRLQQEKRDQDRRLAELEVRLKNEEKALASGHISADPAEIELLRDIIRRQLRVQERRRQARELLIAAAKELGTGDERLSQAIDLFNVQEISLSPEEQKLIADREVDGEFISPFARDRASVGRATNDLQRDISAFERTAEKSFLSGRMLPTRELYQMILDQHPGHTPTLCRLGVVHLKLNDMEAAVDTFRRAAELDEQNAYAHRMLSFALMHAGDIPAAEEPARRAVELAPIDAKSQMLMATISYRLGRPGEAESHFKAAINADPMPSEPYYNLALLCSRDRRYEAARDYYQQALERGAMPDPELEKKIAAP
jgi:tetratricopeptide (TPR) repeat protein/predicted  nucleic acid-binding Zn-ribbon protein